MLQPVSPIKIVLPYLIGIIIVMLLVIGIAVYVDHKKKKQDKK